MAQVKAKIHPDGHVELDGQGFKGKVCDRVMGELAKSLGADPNKITNKEKPEYHMVADQVMGG